MNTYGIIQSKNTNSTGFSSMAGGNLGSSVLHQEPPEAAPLCWAFTENLFLMKAAWIPIRFGSYGNKINQENQIKTEKEIWDWWDVGSITFSCTCWRRTKALASAAEPVADGRRAGLQNLFESFRKHPRNSIKPLMFIWLMSKLVSTDAHTLPVHRC